MGGASSSKSVGRTRTVGEDEGAVGEGWERTAGSSVGPYILERQLGAGAMGVVWEAVDPRLDRIVAIKFTRSERARTTQGRERFVREARALARLSDPYVVTVYDFGFDRDDSYLVMERVQGRSLRQWLQAEPRAQSERLRVMTQAARGLIAAHDLGLIHRDFKPDNVLVGDDGRARVADFGLAVEFEVPSELQDGDSVTAPNSLVSLTQTGAVIGSPAYMAPEQHDSAPLDPRTDQYAFCVSLYEVLVGERPFVGNRYHELVNAKADGPDTVPRRSLPADIDRAIRRGLSVQAHHRWPSMRALVDRLQSQSRQGRLVPVLAGAGILTVAAFAWPQAADRCAGASARISEQWNPEVRRRVDDFLRASPKRHAAQTSSRVLEVLDQHARAWVDTYEESCSMSANEQDAHSLDRRMSCLARSRDGLGAAVTLLAGSDDVVDRALAIASRIPAAERCLQPAEDEGVEAPSGPEVDAVRSEFSHGMQRRFAGDMAGALEAMRRVEAEARRLHHEPLLVRALIERGSLTDSLGNSEGALDPLQEALWRARHNRLDRSVASALTHLAVVEGRSLRDPVAGRRRAGEAKAYLERIGGEAPMAAALANNLGSIAGTSGDFETAKLNYEEAERIWRGFEPDTNSDRFVRALGLSSVLENLGHVAVLGQGDPVQAVERYRAALEELEATLGSEHPELAGIHVGLSEALAAMGQADLAVEHGRRAIGLNIEGYGAVHSEVANAYASVAYAEYARNDMEAAAEALAKAANIRIEVGETLEAWSSRANLALLRAEQGRLTEARAIVRDADEQVTKMVGENHEATLAVRLALGRIARLEGDLVGSIEILRACLRIGGAIYQPHEHNVVQTRVDLAFALGENGDMDGVIEALEPGVEVLDEHPEVDVQTQGRMLSMLAVALSKRDRKRALQLARRAQVVVAHSDDVELKQEAADALARVQRSSNRTRTSGSR